MRGRHSATPVDAPSLSLNAGVLGCSERQRHAKRAAYANLRVVKHERALHSNAKVSGDLQSKAGSPKLAVGPLLHLPA